MLIDVHVRANRTWRTLRKWDGFWAGKKSAWSCTEWQGHSLALRLEWLARAARFDGKRIYGDKVLAAGAGTCDRRAFFRLQVARFAGFRKPSAVICAFPAVRIHVALAASRKGRHHANPTMNRQMEPTITATILSKWNLFLKNLLHFLCWSLGKKLYR